MEKITFQDMATALGMTEEQAQVSLAMPPVSNQVLQHRACCFAELLLKRAIEEGVLESVTGYSWAEVKKTKLQGNRIVAIIQFHACSVPFHLQFETSHLAGHRDALIMRLRRMERHLHPELLDWKEKTDNGWKALQHSMT